MSKKKNVAGTIIAVILAAGAIFLVFFLLKKLALAIVLSGIVFVFGLIFFLFLKKRGDEEQWKGNFGGITPEKVNETVTEGKKKIQKIYNYTYQVPDERVKAKIKELCLTGEKIINDFKEDPKDIKVARRFSNYYLDTTIKILDRYTQLVKNDVRTDEMEEMIKKVEELMDTTMQDIYNKQLERLSEDDVMDLDVEIEMLKKVLKMKDI